MRNIFFAALVICVSAGFHACWLDNLGEDLDAIRGATVLVDSLAIARDSLESIGTAPPSFPTAPPEDCTSGICGADTLEQQAVDTLPVTPDTLPPPVNDTLPAPPDDSLSQQIELPKDSIVQPVADTLPPPPDSIIPEPIPFDCLDSNLKSIHITSVNENRVFMSDTFEIGWSASRNVDSLVLQYYRNGEWKRVAGPFANTGTYSVRLGFSLPDTIMLRLSNPCGNVYADTSFHKPGLELIRSSLTADSRLLFPGGTKTIEWNSKGSIDSVDFFYHTGGIAHLIAGVPNTGSFAWTIDSAWWNSVNLSVAGPQMKSGNIMFTLQDRHSKAYSLIRLYYQSPADYIRDNLDVLLSQPNNWYYVLSGSYNQGGVHYDIFGYETYDIDAQNALYYTRAQTTITLQEGYDALSGRPVLQSDTTSLFRRFQGSKNDYLAMFRQDPTEYLCYPATDGNQTLLGIDILTKSGSRIVSITSYLENYGLTARRNGEPNQPGIATTLAGFNREDPDVFNPVSEPAAGYIIQEVTF